MADKRSRSQRTFQGNVVALSSITPITKPVNVRDTSDISNGIFDEGQGLSTRKGGY